MCALEFGLYSAGSKLLPGRKPINSECVCTQADSYSVPRTQVVLAGTCRSKYQGIPSRQVTHFCLIRSPTRDPPAIKIQPHVISLAVHGDYYYKI